MNAITTIRPAAEEGLQNIGAILPSVLGSIANAYLMRPRYRAVGGMIETIETGAMRTPRSAREWLGHWVEDAVGTENAEVADVSVLHIVSLIHAIRDAEGRGPTPPAANALAVPHRAAA